MATVEEHVLIYPNMTYSSGGKWRHESDSFVADMRAILPRLRTLQPSLRFTMLTPEPVASLSPYCEQIHWPLPTYNNTMRVHFDAPRFLAALDANRRSWDFVWSHLPEQTLAIKNAIYNGTDERPAIVGYSHWCEIPELNTFSADTFPMWLAGALAMERCGVTTYAMKRAVQRHASGYLSSRRLSDLDRIVRPMYLGTDAPLYAAQTPERGLLVWNHRTATYTGYPLALAAMDDLWTRRQDFRVVVTLADGATARPYMVPSGLPRSDAPHYRRAYFGLLSRGWLGLPRLSSHWTWPVAVADGMSAGLPYVVPEDFYIGECLPRDYPFQYDGGKNGATGLADAIDAAMDSDSRDLASAMSMDAAKATSWDNRVPAFSEMFDAARATIRATGARSTAYPAVRDLAASGATKREIKRRMRWGNGIPWTPYRRRLAQDGLSMTESRYWTDDD